MANKPDINELFAYNPWIHHGDPGPEIYHVVSSLPEERQQAVAAIVSRAVGEIAGIKGAAYGQIANVLGAKQNPG